MKLFLSFTILICTLNSFVCPCKDKDLGEINSLQYDKYDIIFKGKVINIKKGNSSNTTTVIVEKFYKGTKIDTIVDILSTGAYGPCTINLKKDEIWLFYGYLKNEEIVTDLCTRTSSLNKNTKDTSSSVQRAKRDIIFLEKKVLTQK